MAAPLLAAGVAAGVNIIGGILGSILGSGDRDRAQSLLEEALAEIEAVGAPPDLSRELILEKFYQAGMYTPELEDAINLGVSKVAEIQEDPELKQAQTRALELLKQRAETGLGPEERAELNQINTSVNREVQAAQADIIRNMQQRGMAGGGSELAARLSASQAGANRLSEESDRMAANASQRALQALASSGDMASQIRNQDFNVANTKASAADEFQRFNVNAAQERESRRVQNENLARQIQTRTEQSIADANVGMGNQEQQRQRRAEETDYTNTRQRANDLAGAKSDMAGFYAGEAGRTEKLVGGVAGGLGKIGAGLMDTQPDARQLTPSEINMDTQLKALETPSVRDANTLSEEDRERYKRMRALSGSSGTTGVA